MLTAGVLRCLTATGSPLWVVLDGVYYPSGSVAKPRIGSLAMLLVQQAILRTKDSKKQVPHGIGLAISLILPVRQSFIMTLKAFIQEVVGLSFHNLSRAGWRDSTAKVNLPVYTLIIRISKIFLQALCKVWYQMLFGQFSILPLPNLSNAEVRVRRSLTYQISIQMA